VKNDENDWPGLKKLMQCLTSGAREQMAVRTQNVVNPTSNKNDEFQRNEKKNLTEL
jgi:hypothetical protein